MGCRSEVKKYKKAEVLQSCFLSFASPPSSVRVAHPRVFALWESDMVESDSVMAQCWFRCSPLVLHANRVSLYARGVMLINSYLKLDVHTGATHGPQKRRLHVIIFRRYLNIRKNEHLPRLTFANLFTCKSLGFARIPVTY